MSDYEVTIKVRNGRILRRMEALGIESQAELARRAGVTFNRFNAIITLRLQPQNKDGSWKPCVLDLAGVLQCDPSDLFTEKQLTPVAKNSATVYMDEANVEQLIDRSSMERAAWAKLEVGKLLGCLNYRERAVVEARMDGATLDETVIDLAEADKAERGTYYEVTRDRVRQLEARAHRKMRGAKIQFRSFGNLEA